MLSLGVCEPVKFATRHTKPDLDAWQISKRVGDIKRDSDIVSE